MKNFFNIFILGLSLLNVILWGGFTNISKVEAGQSTSQKNSSVVLYATSWCPYCEKARKFLAANSIKYTEYDIEKSEDGKAQYDKLGVSGIPVFMIGNQLVRGFDEGELLNALQKIKQ